MLISGEDETYCMCFARRKCDRPQNDKGWFVLYIMFPILLLILAAIYPRTQNKEKKKRLLYQ